MSDRFDTTAELREIVDREGDDPLVKACDYLAVVARNLSARRRNDGRNHVTLGERQEVAILQQVSASLLATIDELTVRQAEIVKKLERPQ